MPAGSSNERYYERRTLWPPGAPERFFLVALMSCSASRWSDIRALDALGTFAECEQF
jgi:hypothetical protein